MPTKSEEIERVITAYLGGKLCEGEVPIGAQLVAELGAELAARFAAKGFTLSLEKHKDEEALVVASLKGIATPRAPVAVEAKKEA